MFFKKTRIQSVNFILSITLESRRSLGLLAVPQEGSFPIPSEAQMKRIEMGLCRL